MRHLLCAGFLAFAMTAEAMAAQPLAMVTVATTPIDVGAEVLYAKDMGFFKKHGLSVNVLFVDNGAASASGIISGALDIAQGNIVTLASEHAKGLPLVVLAPAALYSSAAPTTELIVAKNSPLRTAKDLNGKTIGINGAGNITQIAAMAWMDQNGGDPYSVKFVVLRFAEMAPAVADGRIDAAVVAEPSLTDAVAGPLARVLAPIYTAIAPTFIIGAWFTSSDWARAHPDLAARFVAAIVDAAIWANKHQARSAKILENYTKIEANPARKHVIFPEKSDLTLMQPLIDAAAKYKVITASFPAADLSAIK